MTNEEKAKEIYKDSKFELEVKGGVQDEQEILFMLEKMAAWKDKVKPTLTTEDIMLCERYEDKPFAKMPNSEELIQACNEDLDKLKKKGLDEDPERYAFNAFMDGFGYGYVVWMDKVKPTLTTDEIMRILNIESEFQDETPILDIQKMSYGEYCEEILKRYLEELSKEEEK